MQSLYYINQKRSYHTKQLVDILYIQDNQP